MNRNKSGQIKNDLESLIKFEADLKIKIDKYKNNYFYRGQFNSKWNLESSYKRDFQERNGLTDDDKISSKDLVFITDEQIKYINKRLSQKKEKLQILAELQHYGSPTLLIDFTSNFWNAVWFAISDNNIKKENPEHFEIYYFKLNKSKSEKYILEDLTGNEIYHCPSEINNGLAQKSYFIVDNTNNLEVDWNVQSILIPYSLRNDLLKFLDLNKINSTTIFPGLKGLYESFQYYSESSLLFNGIQLGKRKRWDESIEKFDIVLNLDPNSMFAYFNKGVSLLNNNNFEEALENFNKTKEIDPKYSECYRAAGNSLIGLEKFQEALNEYNFALKLGQNNADIYRDKGNVLIEMKNYDEAIINFDYALSLNPNYIEIYYDKAFALFKINKIDETRECFDKIIKINFYNSKVFYNKETILESLRKYDKVIENLNKNSGLDLTTKRMLDLKEILIKLKN